MKNVVEKMAWPDGKELSSGCGISGCMAIFHKYSHGCGRNWGIRKYIAPYTRNTVIIRKNIFNEIFL